MAPELRLSDARALDALAELLGTSRWDGPTIDRVAHVVASTGRYVDQTSSGRGWLDLGALHASPSPSTSEDTGAESVAQVPASVKGGRWLPCLRGSPELPPCETYEAACAAIEASPLAHKAGWTVRDTEAR